MAASSVSGSSWEEERAKDREEDRAEEDVSGQPYARFQTVGGGVELGVEARNGARPQSCFCG
jgi:hypothetical protein